MFQDETTLHSLVHSASARFSRYKRTISSISFLWLDTFIKIFDLLLATSFSSNKNNFMNEQGFLTKYFQFSFIFYLHRTTSFNSNQNIFIDRRSTSHYLSSLFWSTSIDFIQKIKFLYCMSFATVSSANECAQALKLAERANDMLYRIQIWD
jgi:hypothetical protein